MKNEKIKTANTSFIFGTVISALCLLIIFLPKSNELTERNRDLYKQLTEISGQAEIRSRYIAEQLKNVSYELGYRENEISRIREQIANNIREFENFKNQIELERTRSITIAKYNTEITEQIAGIRKNNNRIREILQKQND